MEIEKTATEAKEPMILSSKKKWFWIGIVLTTLNTLSGIIYGIALFRERAYRKEAKIIIVWSVVWTIGAAFLYQWLLQHGYLHRPEFLLPKAQILPRVN